MSKVTEPAPGPVWWTVLGKGNFIKPGTEDKPDVPPRSMLVNGCYKSQTWFNARSKLGGHPKRLDVVAGKAYARCVRKLEKVGR